MGREQARNQQVLPLGEGDSTSRKFSFSIHKIGAVITRHVCKRQDLEHPQKRWGGSQPRDSVSTAKRQNGRELGEAELHFPFLTSIGKSEGDLGVTATLLSPPWNQTFFLKKNGASFLLLLSTASNPVQSNKQENRAEERNNKNS